MRVDLAPQTLTDSTPPPRKETTADLANVDAGSYSITTGNKRGGGGGGGEMRDSGLSFSNFDFSLPPPSLAFPPPSLASRGQNEVNNRFTNHDTNGKPPIPVSFNSFAFSKPPPPPLSHLPHDNVSSSQASFSRSPISAHQSSRDEVAAGPQMVLLDRCFVIATAAQVVGF